MIANIALTSFLISHIPILIEVDVEPTGLGSFVPSETGNNTNNRRGSGLVIESFWHHCGVECSTVVVLVFTHSKVSNFDDRMGHFPSDFFIRYLGFTSVEEETEKPSAVSGDISNSIREIPWRHVISITSLSLLRLRLLSLILFLPLIMLEHLFLRH